MAEQRDWFASDTGTVELPAFFASISSLKTSLSESDYLRVVQAAGYPSVLVSAFDIEKLSDEDAGTFRQQLSDSIRAGQSVLFDSGNYESFWLRSDSWTQEKFHSVLRKFPCSFAFSFDVQASDNEPSDIARAIANSLEVDRKAGEGIPIFPIIHGTPSNLSQVVSALAKESKLEMIAVPERELGTGIVERTATLAKIRSALDESIAIHLLGTGNPLSIVTYTLAGASSFDGLEWCQTAVNGRTGLLHHLSHGELFFETDEFRVSGLGVGAYTLLQNLRFFSGLVEELKLRRQNTRKSSDYDAIFAGAQEILKRVGA